MVENDKRPKEEVAIAETAPSVPNKTPFKDEAKLVVPLTFKEPTLTVPPRYDFCAFGSNQYLAVVVEVPPTVTMSLALLE